MTLMRHNYDWVVVGWFLILNVSIKSAKNDNNNKRSKLL